jgi:hypothetical protein
MPRTDPITTIFAELDRLAAALRRRRAYTALTAVVAGTLWASLLFVLADLALRLPSALCWLAWALLLAAAAVGGFFSWRHVMAPLSHTSVSASVEAAHPEYRNRLINIVQFATATAPEDQAFAARLAKEGGPPPVARVSGGEIWSARAWRAAAIAAAIAALGSAIVAAMSPTGYLTSLRRLLTPMAGIAPYSLTRIASIAPGNTAVVRGQPLTVTVEFEGVVPRRAELELLTDDHIRKTLTMRAAVATPQRFEVALPPQHNHARYRILGNDARSEFYRITVNSPPALTSWTAAVTPPEYTGRAAYSLSPDAADMSVPGGAQIELQWQASQPLRAARVLQGDTGLGDAKIRGANATAGTVTFALAAGMPATIELRAVNDLVATVPLPLAAVPDAPPAVDFDTAERQLTVGSGRPLELAFAARDDFGVASVRLEQLLGGRKHQVVATRAVAGGAAPEVFGRFAVDAETLRLRPGKPTRIRLAAVDAVNGEGYSRILQVVLPESEEQRRRREEMLARQKLSITALIQQQKANLKLSRTWESELQRGRIIPASALDTLAVQQAAIRDGAQALLQREADLGLVGRELAALVDGEMAQAVSAFSALKRAAPGDQAHLLPIAIELEVRILAALSGVPATLDGEESFRAKADLLAQLQKLVKQQKANLQLTREAAGRDTVSDDVVSALVETQEDVAMGADDFIAAAKIAAAADSEDDFAAQLAAAVQLLGDAALYEQLLTASGQLEDRDWPAAVQTEETCLSLLAKALAVMNAWRVKKARDTLTSFNATLEKLADTLSDLEEKQQKIVETSRELERRKVFDDDVRDKLRQMDEEQKTWSELVEELAQDLYQFPELPVANELNGKMREVFEDVEQAADSENAPAVEIAVEKEESLLDKIKNTKERVEDVEMWMPDKPDNIEWNLESFDAAEFPEMPLVDLPDELEDIVGDLLDQAEEIAAQSEDSTGNHMMADAEMGWDIMDGPMPSFSAKGKSGNTRPNDNEMTGRSGAGREGQSNGEVIENKVKGLEGTDPHVRRTKDAFQKGMVEEEEDSTMDAKATGGGKLGGESETQGLFGNAPRRDLQQGGSTVSDLRQETEAMYAKARLMYLGNTDGLDEAARAMRLLEQSRRDQGSFDSVQQRVMRRLRTSRAGLGDGAVLPMQLNGPQSAGGAAALNDFDLDAIDEEYRGLVSDYFKNLGN